MDKSALCGRMPGVVLAYLGSPSDLYLNESLVNASNSGNDTSTFTTVTTMPVTLPGGNGGEGVRGATQFTSISKDKCVCPIRQAPVYEGSNLVAFGCSDGKF